MLEALITSKTRIKLLLKFFLNPNTSAYLRGLATEFDESSNSVRLELNRLEEAGMIKSVSEGNKKVFQVNKKHSLYNSIQQIVRKYAGIDQIVDNIVKGLGNLEKAYLTGDLAKGKNGDIIDLILVGDINKSYLLETVSKAEKASGKKIKYIIYTNEEALKLSFNSKEFLLIYNG
ncbi:MAG: helix-turn-helix transcriptional regulator [Bacteroidetes bacterium]|nr:helix-turn-helix transcriptional regulator [Bacteroidota bacterium]